MNLNFKGYFITPIYTTSIKKLTMPMLKKKLKKCSLNILNHMGYDLNNYKIILKNYLINKLFENKKKSFKQLKENIHHISGFYFLKCTNKDLFLLFNDPRLIKASTQLPLKNEFDVTFGSSFIEYKPQVGNLILFPSFLQHQFSVNYNTKSFKFIYFTLQAVEKNVYNKSKIKI